MKIRDLIKVPEKWVPIEALTEDIRCEGANYMHVEFMNELDKKLVINKQELRKILDRLPVAYHMAGISNPTKTIIDALANNPERWLK